MNTTMIETEEVKKRVRAKATIPTLAYKYDVTEKPKIGLNLSPLSYLRDQLKLARLFRNKLFELEIKRRKQFDEIRKKYSPDLVEAEIAFNECVKALEDFDTILKARNAQERKKRVTEEEKQQKAILKDTYKLAKERLKAAKEKANESAQGEELEAMETAHKQELKDARAEAIAKGLYTFSANGITDSLRDIRKGTPPQFRKWDGSGFLYCQVQAGEQSYDPITWIDALQGQDTRLRAKVVGKYTLLQVRLGSDVKKQPIWVDVPLTMHRVPPPEAIIKGVKLNCRRIGRAFKWTVAISLANPNGWEKTDLATEGTVCVDLGRRAFDHGVRVAVWKGSDGKTGELWIPKEFQGNGTGSLEYATKPESLQSIRDKEFDPIKAELLEYLSGKEFEWVEMKGLHQSKSKDRFLAIVNNWQRHEGDQLIYEKLNQWRKKEIHLERWQADQTKKFRVWRLHYYRNFWAMLRKQYATVVLQKINWVTIDPLPETNEDNTALNYWKHAVANGELDELCNARKVVRLAPNYRECECGCTTHYDKKFRIHECVQCGKKIDVDWNDCRILFNRLHEIE